MRRDFYKKRFFEIWDMANNEQKNIHRSLFHQGLKSFMERKKLYPYLMSKTIGGSPAVFRNMIESQTTPSYEILRGLLENGMTLEECFGQELAEKIRRNGVQENEQKALVKEVTRSEIESSVKGVIRSELISLLKDLAEPKKGNP